MYFRIRIRSLTILPSPGQGQYLCIPKTLSVHQLEGLGDKISKAKLKSLKSTASKGTPREIPNISCSQSFSMCEPHKVAPAAGLLHIYVIVSRKNNWFLLPLCLWQTFNRTNMSTSALCLGSQCRFAFYGGETSYHRYLFVLQLSNLLVFLWLVNFSLALEQCTLAGTFASYYWARRRPQDIPPCPLFSSFSRAVRWQTSMGLLQMNVLCSNALWSDSVSRYHTGSLAFGALILSLVQIFRNILEYVEQKLKGGDQHD